MSASLTLLQVGNGESEPALLPVGWQVKPLSRVFRQISSGTTPPTDEPGYYGNDVHWVTTGELRETAIQSSKAMLTNAAIQKFSALRIYPEGTLLIAMYGATVGRMGWLEVPAATNQACCALVDAGSGSARFVFYCLLAAMESILILSSGGGQPNINQEKLRSFRIPQPPSTLQHVIATFLDRETGKIDALVGEQERLIALLKEKRQAVISQAVTRGLDPTVPMKNSGVEWLGEVPARWDVKRLKQIANGITVGVVVIPAQYYAETGVPALRSQNVREMIIDLSGLVYFSDESNELLRKSMLRAGDLVSVRTGQPGVTAVVPDELDGINCIDLIVVRRSETMNSRFVSYIMNSNICKIQYEQGSGGAIQQHFNIETAGNLTFAVPSVDIQTEVVLYLDQAMEKLDRLRAEATRAIALLRERRAALIAAAVTGKIDVRDYVDISDARAA